MKKHYKLIILFVLIVSIIAGGFTFYINRKEKINILDYLSIIEKGADTKGTISVTSNKEKIQTEITDSEVQQNLLLTLNNLTYSFDKETDLSNNDTVTISIDTNHSQNKSIINKYKISPSQKSLEYKMSQLLTIPEWNELSEEDKIKIDGMIQENVLVTKQKFYALEGKRLFGFFNKEVPIQVNEVLDSIYYQRNLEECGQDKNIKESTYALYCGTVVYVYRYDYSFLESKYSFNSSYKPNYYAHEVTNIYTSDTIDKNYLTVNKTIPDDDNIGFYWFTDIEDKRAFFLEQNYERIQ